MEARFDIVVQKYGGSSVADPQKIASVAGFIKDRLQTKKRLCVVVSAMGDSTNQLIDLAHKVNPDPPKRELDMLISCGERSSMALLAMALNRLGIKALSLTGSQSGIITDECHSGAEIIAIRPTRVLEAFADHQVVIIAGFQGMSRAREITTLRRGGSDTTAVAMAAALKAECCEIFSDVAGVMDIDPRIVPHAQVIPTLEHDQACLMSLYGAKILGFDAAMLARELKVQLLVGQAGFNQSGTAICERAIKNASSQSVRAISHLRGVIRIEQSLNTIEISSSGYILCGALSNGNFVAYASNDIAQELGHMNPEQIQAGLALITLHLHKQAAIPQVFSQLFEIFMNNSLDIVDLIAGAEQIFVVVNDVRLSEALSLSHARFLGDSHD